MRWKLLAVLAATMLASCGGGSNLANAVDWHQGTDVNGTSAVGVTFTLPQEAICTITDKESGQVNYNKVVPAGTNTMLVIGALGDHGFLPNSNVDGYDLSCEAR